MKKLGIVLFLVFLLGGTVGAFAWWDQLTQNAADQTLDMGYGVRLELDNQTVAGQGELIPAGSFFAGQAGYTTSYSFTYVLNLEETLGTFDLLIDVTALQVGLVDYLKGSTHQALNVGITASSGTFLSDATYSNTISTANTALRMNNVLVGTGALTITITFTLAAQSEELTTTDYENVSGKTIDFDVAFEIPAFADQSANQG